VPLWRGGALSPLVPDRRGRQLVLADLLQDVLRQPLDALVLPGEDDLLVAGRNHFLAHQELEQQVERALFHLERVELAVDGLERERLVHVFLVRALRDEDTSGLQHVRRDALVEPAFAAHALPLEVARKIRVGVRVGILEVDVDGVTEGLARRDR
jgi:hypothetical protein